MEINSGHLRIHHLHDMILRNKVIVPIYQRKFCWDDDKINLFIDSLDKGIPIGVFQFRKLDDGFIEVVDGLHRIRLLFKILLGNGIYYNFQTKKFTTNKNDYDYSKFVNVERLTAMNILRHMDSNNIDFDLSKIFAASYEKVYFTELLKFEFYGTDEEVAIAFERINQEGVSFTPTFNKVDKQEFLTL